MSENTVNSHFNEISGLVPIAQHEREESKKFSRKKKRKKQQPGSTAAEDVEDLLHHPEDEHDEQADADGPADTESGGEEHLDLLL